MEEMKKEVSASKSNKGKGQMKGVWSIIDNNNHTKPIWIRMGTAYVNKDSSLNVYLEAAPKSFKLHIRDLDPEKLGSNKKAG